MNKIANKQVICNVLVEAGKKDKDIMVLCSDSRGSGSMTEFADTLADQFVEEAKQSRSIDVIYYPDINEYNGNRTLQIVVRAYKLHS